MAILLGALKTAAEEVNSRAAPAGRGPRDPLNVLSCTAPDAVQTIPQLLN